jgi:hypothetical protein
MYIWDETKRQSNIEKHGLDFLDAALMYENPDRCTYLSGRPDESRRLDRALVRVHGRVVALIYTLRGEDVRIISFRVAPREERKRHEQDTK